MTSHEKVFALLEALQDEEDGEIAQALPVGLPVPAIRAALVMIAGTLPADAVELDRWLEQLGMFCLGLRSDENGSDTQPLLQADNG
jgi:hypothetical protein